MPLPLKPTIKPQLALPFVTFLVFRREGRTLGIMTACVFAWEEKADESGRFMRGEMQRYERSATPGPRTRLGVGIFAFENPVLGNPRLRRRVPPKRSRFRRRKGRR